MGFLVGILTGLSSSFQNNQFKKLTGVDGSFLNGIRFLGATLLLATLISLFSLWEVPESPFFIIVLISIPIEMLGAYFYVRAFQHSDQSLIGPLFSMTVIFLVPLEYLIFGHVPSMLGWLGILMGLLGSLFLGWDIDKPRELTASFARVMKEKGVGFILVSTILGSLAIVSAKFSYEYTTPLISGFYIVGGLAILHLPKVFLGIRQFPKHLAPSLLKMVTGYSSAMTLHYIGLFLLPAAYFISIKRSSVIFDVLFGKFIHDEKHFSGRLIGGSLMVGGLILIALA